MKIIKQILLGWTLFLAPVIIILSCQKKEGCTDNLADNYCEDCKSDDSQCNYTSTLTFWKNQEEAQELVDNGCSTFYIYADGILVAQEPAGNYWNGAPSCGHSDAMNWHTTYSGNPRKSVSLMFRVDNFNLGAQNIVIVPGCSVEKL